MPLSQASEILAKHEAEKKFLEASMAECNRLLEKMREADPAEAEHLKKRIDTVVKGAPKLPLDFKRKLTATARIHERNANTRATHTTLMEAMRIARTDDIQERNRLIGEVRRYCSKAMALGADRDFRASADRRIEIVLMSGHVEQKGPSFAKPLSAAPKVPSAKV